MCPHAILLSSLMLLGTACASAQAGTPAAESTTLTGAMAQHSPQAEVFLQFEEALLDHGIDATAPYVTPARMAQMKSDMAQFGADGFREFQQQMRAATPRGDARRAQIETLIITGNKAVLSARSGPNMVDEVHLTKVGNDWKIDASQLPKD